MSKINKTVVCDNNKDFEQELVVGQQYNTLAEDNNFYKITGLWFPKELFHDYLEEEADQEQAEIKKYDRLVDGEEAKQEPVGVLVCNEKLKDYGWSTFTVTKLYCNYGVIEDQYYAVRDDEGDLVWAEQDMFDKVDPNDIDDGEEVYTKPTEEDDFSFDYVVNQVKSGEVLDYVVVGTTTKGEGVLYSSVDVPIAQGLLASAIRCLTPQEDLRDVKEVFPHVEQHRACTGRIMPDKTEMIVIAEHYGKKCDYLSELLFRAINTRQEQFIDKAINLLRREEIATADYPNDFIEEQLELGRLIKEFIKLTDKEEAGNE